MDRLTVRDSSGDVGRQLFDGPLLPAVKFLHRAAPVPLRNVRIRLAPEPAPTVALPVEQGGSKFSPTPRTVSIAIPHSRTRSRRRTSREAEWRGRQARDADDADHELRLKKLRRAQRFRGACKPAGLPNRLSRLRSSDSSFLKSRLKFNRPTEPTVSSSAIAVRVGQCRFGIANARSDPATRSSG